MMALVRGVIAASISVGVDVQRGRVDVDQLDVGAQVAHHLRRGGEGVRGGDHLVARADAQRLEREVQAGGGRVDGDAMQRGIAEERGELRLEPLGLRAGGDPARTQRVDHLGDLFFADVGHRKGQEGFGHARVFDPRQHVRAQQRQHIEHRVQQRMQGGTPRAPVAAPA